MAGHGVIQAPKQFHTKLMGMSLFEAAMAGSAPQHHGTPESPKIDALPSNLDQPTTSCHETVLRRPSAFFGQAKNRLAHMVVEMESHPLQLLHVGTYRRDEP